MRVFPESKGQFEEIRTLANQIFKRDELSTGHKTDRPSQFFELRNEKQLSVTFDLKDQV